MTQEDRDYVRDQLKFIADLLHDMVEVDALREGLTVEEWTRKADQEIARHRVRFGVSANRLHGFGRFKALGRMALS
jgi:hypothetical protein